MGKHSFEMPKQSKSANSDAHRSEARERILTVASDLFYREGARAVGVDLIVERAGVAKTSLYRHFPTKDDLIAAFLRREDEDFWRHWDLVANEYKNQPQPELEAQLRWIGQRVSKQNYRGCPQLNMAAEFPEPNHPARRVAVAHKKQLRERLYAIAQRLKVRRAGELAAQLAVLINGAFVSSAVFAKDEATQVLIDAARALISAAA
jgi:AcrR family transcriptional regulator